MERVAPDEALRPGAGRREDRRGNAPVELPCSRPAADGSELDLGRARVGESLREGVVGREGAARFPVAVCAEVLVAGDRVVVRADELFWAAAIVEVGALRRRGRSGRGLRRRGLRSRGLRGRAWRRGCAWRRAAAGAGAGRPTARDHQCGDARERGADSPRTHADAFHRFSDHRRVRTPDIPWAQRLP